MSGWVKLHRKLLENPIFCNSNLLQVWVWCLLKASHKSYVQIVGLKEISLKEGQFITGRFKGSEELNLNPSTFYKYLKKLEGLKMISLNSNNKMTVVTVENWGKYQFEEEESNNKITTKEQQNNTNKNVKNIKNNIYSAFFEEVWKMYPNKKGKGKVSDSTKKKIYKLGDEFKRCIERYLNDLEKDKDWRKPQNGSTFFNSGYVDYLDENYIEKVEEEDDDWRGTSRRLE